MTATRRPSCALLAAIMAIILVASAACTTDRAATASSRETRRLQEELRSVQTRYQQLEKSYKKLRESVAGQATSQDGKLPRLQLLLLEREAQIKDLARRMEDAIQEVVRAKAKLRSLQSKAEAASNIAEAEIALKSLKQDAHERSALLHQAEALLQMASQEFKKENYGGALYLSAQAKAQIKEGEELAFGRDKTPLLGGETAFVLPLPLQLGERAKLRETPGAEKTRATLDRGTPVLGLSFKGEWIRVKSDDGQSGWVSYSQVLTR